MTIEQDLEQLAARASAGDADALREVLERIRPQVQRRVAKFLPCKEDAEEAAQDTLMAVATKIHMFSGTGTFAGRLTVVATNCARQTYRSLKRRSVERATEHMPEALDPRTTSVIAGSGSICWRRSTRWSPSIRCWSRRWCSATSARCRTPRSRTTWTSHWAPSRPGSTRPVRAWRPS